MNNFFKERNGSSSSTRLIFFIGSIWVMAMTTYLGIAYKVDVPMLIAFYSGIQSILIGLKLGSKPMEK